MFANCTILHIDDDVNDSVLLRRALAHNGFAGTYQHVSSALEAISCLTEAKGGRPDLLVTDCQFPADDDNDFIRWARANEITRNVPIVVFSGTINPSLQRSVFDRGATAFFSKSGDLNQIVRAVRQLVDGR